MAIATTRYSALAGGEEKPPGRAGSALALGSGTGSSPDSLGSARFTPDEDSNADDDDDEGLDELEAGHGYELRPISTTSHRRRADENEKWHDEDEEKEGREDEDEDEDVDEDVNVGAPSQQRRRRHRRGTSVQSFELYTPDEERSVRRKLDTRLVLFVALLYLISFLDRSNIGNAKVAGLTDDLHLSDDQYEWLLTAFYITYILFEWMTLCYKIFPPHIYISCCVCAWGVLASLQSVTTGWAGLLVLRALLGIGEAAFVGVPFYLSFFFRKDELAVRIGLFISAAPLATSFASSLAWAIVSVGDHSPIASWRLLFLIEGFPACFIAVWAWWWIPDGPSSARWLTRRERTIATLRMRKEAGVTAASASAAAIQSHVPRHQQKFQWREVLRTLRDPKAYLTAGIFFCCNVAFSSMPVFLPTILQSFNFSRHASQGLSAPPFLFAFVAVLLTAVVSDRLRSRSIPIIVHALAAMAGYIFLATAGALRLGTTARYLAVFPICAGFFSAVTLVITWTVNNQPSDEGKGTGMAMLNVVGQMGPLLGTRLYPDRDAPYYVMGMSVCAVAMVLVAVLAFALRRVLQADNTRRQHSWKTRQAEDESLVGKPSSSEPFMYLT